MKEIWKDIEGYEGYYQVSNFGNVRSLDRYIMHKNGKEYFHHGVNMAHVDNGNGYKYVSLYGKDGKHKRVGIHRLVATAFLPNPDNLPEVNHLDDKPFDHSNNAVWNLQWCTDKENQNYGEHKNRVGIAQGHPVIQFDKNWNVVAKFHSAREADKQTGIKNSLIIKCCHGKGITAGGFYWRFEDALDIPIPKNKNIKPVNQYTLDKHNFIKRYDTMTKAANETNTCLGSISNCCAGKTIQAGGFYWEYADE